MWEAVESCTPTWQQSNARYYLPYFGSWNTPSHQTIQLYLNSTNCSLVTWCTLAGGEVSRNLVLLLPSFLVQSISLHLVFPSTPFSERNKFPLSGLANSFIPINLFLPPAPAAHIFSASYSPRNFIILLLPSFIIIFQLCTMETKLMLLVIHNVFYSSSYFFPFVLSAPHSAVGTEELEVELQCAWIF